MVPAPPSAPLSWLTFWLTQQQQHHFTTSGKDHKFRVVADEVKCKLRVYKPMAISIKRHWVKKGTGRGG